MDWCALVLSNIGLNRALLLGAVECFRGASLTAITKLTTVYSIHCSICAPVDLRRIEVATESSRFKFYAISQLFEI